MLAEKRNRDDEDDDMDNNERPRKIRSIDEESENDEDNIAGTTAVDSDKENWSVNVSWACSDANNHDRHSIRLFFLFVRTVQAPIHRIALFPLHYCPDSEFF